MPTDKPFLSFVIDPQLLERVDEFRFRMHFPSRAMAIKHLLNWALNQKVNQKEPPMTGRFRVQHLAK